MPAATESTLNPEQERRVEALRAWRKRTAAAEGVSPFVVAYDKTLRAIAAARPGDLPALRAVGGMTALRVEQHGEAILRALDEADAASSPRQADYRLRLAAAHIIRAHRFASDLCDAYTERHVSLGLGEDHALDLVLNGLPLTIAERIAWNNGAGSGPEATNDWAKAVLASDHASARRERQAEARRSA